MINHLVGKARRAIRGRGLRALSFIPGTTWNRPPPEFLVVGAAKSGTTSFYHYLTQHPGVLAAENKEINFFSLYYDRGLRWYRLQFPSRLADQRITGEASPYYLFHPLAAERIETCLPNAKLIAVLRDPTDRAVSHYQHNRRKGREPRDLITALQEEEDMILPETRALEDDGRHTSSIHKRYAYKGRGLYADQLDRFSYFVEAGQLLVVSAEQLYARPAETMRRTYEYLGIGADFVPSDLKIKNEGEYVEDDSTITAIEYLRQYFAPHNSRLYELIGRDLGWK